MLAASLDLDVAYKIEASPLLVVQAAFCWWHARSPTPQPKHAGALTRGAMLPPLPLQDSVQSGRVEVQGLRVETRFISGGGQHSCWQYLLSCQRPCSVRTSFVARFRLLNLSHV